MDNSSRRYLALACDYDGTIAVEGRVGNEVLAALRRLRGSGRKLVLVTGRILESLRDVFPQVDLFDRIVLENGAVIFTPATGAMRLLAKPPPGRFEEELRARGVLPLASGKVVVATTVPHEGRVLETIRDFGLELQIIFNKGSVMVLPGGVTKATGLSAALEELDVRREQVVGVGDAENDHAFLAQCGCAVAVADALPALRAQADWVTRGGAGTGVIELVDRLLKNDLEGVKGRGASPP